MAETKVIFVSAFLYNHDYCRVKNVGRKATFGRITELARYQARNISLNLLLGEKTPLESGTNRTIIKIKDLSVVVDDFCVPMEVDDMRAYLSHFTQRNMFFVSMIFLLTFLIAGCSQTNRGHDRVVVYNAAHKRVTVITGKGNLKQFSNIAGDAGTKDTKLTRKLPQTAKVKYYYVIQQAKPKVTLKMTIYANSKYSKLENIPIVGKVTYRLSDSDYQKFSHPKSFTNQ